MLATKSESEDTRQAMTPARPTVGRVLVVDDEVELKNALVDALTAQSYEVSGFTNGEEALAALRLEDFDLLISDLMMPEMDGITLIKAAMEIDPHLVGIIMTGQGTIQTALDAMKAGTFDYVLKPFRLQTLMPILTRAINTRRLRMENLHLRETVAIYGLCQTITSTLDEQTILSKLADAALQQSSADEVSILLPTEDGKELVVAAVRGEKRERLLGERVMLEEGISSWVARERAPLILDGEVQDDPFFALWSRSDMRSAISIPMQVANKLVGIINLNTTNRLRPFTLGQMKALTLLAGTAAAALESASLYTRVRRTEEKYRSIFENAIEGLFQTSPEGRLLTANPALARTMGYSSAEEMVANLTNVSQQVYVRPAVRDQIARLQKEASPLVAYEMEVYRKDGSKIWVSVNRRAVRDFDNRVIFFEGSVEDITARRQIEEENRRTRQQYESLVHAIDGIVWEMDAQSFSFTFVSKQCERILGYTPEQWLSEPEFWPNHLHPDDQSWVVEFCRDAVNQKRDHEFDYRMIAADGRVVWLRDIVTVDKTGTDRPQLRGVMVDITERKLSEDELKRSEERYRDLVENAEDLIYEHDLKGNYTASNKAGERITGYTLEESLNLNLTQTVAPECLEKAREMMRRKLAGEHVTAYELVILGKDGRRIPVEVNTRLVMKDGVAVGVQGIARDLSQRNFAEQALRDSEARTRAILESAMDCIITMDHQGRVVDWNPAAERTFGYSREEAIGGEMAEMIIPERYREHHCHGLERYLSTRNSRLLGKRIELAATRRDGSEFPIELTITRIDLEGQPMFTGYLRDITSRKKAETRLAAQYAVTRALAESNTLAEGAAKILQALCESLGWEYGALWTVDRKANALKCSEVWQAPDAKSQGMADPGAQPLFEAADGLPGRVWKDNEPVWIADLVEDSNIPRSAAMASAGLKSGCAFPIRLRQEVLGVVEFFSRTVRESDPELLAMMITMGSQIGQFIERTRVEEALCESEEQLRQSQKLEAIGQLAGGVAHDFNNLLTVICGYSSILIGKLPQDSPHRTSVEEIKKAGDRASGLTSQLLAFSRKQILEPTILDLKVVVTDLEKMVRRLIGEDIDLLTLTSPGLGKVKADPGQIEQVLLNLIVNARDAMPQGGKITLETRNVVHSEEYAKRHATRPGAYVMMAVSDTGEGIEASIQPRIFDPFFTTKVSGHGTGLGLATVYGIVKQSGGNIWVYSEVGQGTTFKVFLPRIWEASEEQAVQSDSVIPGGTELILLVEDEEQVRGILAQILEGQGYQVLAASNGEQALQFAGDPDNDIRLMITDVVMPQMSGRELAEHVARLRPSLPVLFMSGYTDDAIVRHGLLDKKLNFIQKPFDSAGVARKVREVLDS